MGLPRKFMLGLVRGLEAQGGVARRTSGGGWLIKNPATGKAVTVHSSPGRWSAKQSTYEREVAAAGFTWPEGVRL
jgi:hypothetical protein